MNSITSNLNTLVHSYRRRNLNSIILPSIFVIEPTNHCNLKCVICPDKKHIKKEYMSLEAFQEVVLQIKDYARTIYLHLHGEPLMHGQIIEMIHICKQNTKAKISLSTNATLLNEKLAADIICSGLDEIVFSLDSSNGKTFEKIKGADFFDVAVTNIKRFFMLKEDKKPRTVVKMVQHNLNKNENNDFVKEWSSYDCKVHVSRLNSWANQLENYNSLSDQIDSHSGVRVPCADLWFKMVINCKGKVLLCCHDYKNKYIIGDLLKENIRDIWNSEFLHHVRQSHLNSNFDNMCKLCREWSTEYDEYAHFEEFSLLPIGRP